MIIRSIGAALCAFLLLSSCGGSGGSGQVESAPKTPTYEKVKISNATLVEIRNAVRQGLKDPTSAKFGQYKSLAYTEVADKILYSDVYSQKVGQSVTAVCGKINAKNSYGGYTGMKLFLAEKRDNSDWKIYSDGYGTMMCSNRGFNVTVGGNFKD